MGESSCHNVSSSHDVQLEQPGPVLGCGGFKQLWHGRASRADDAIKGPVCLHCVIYGSFDSFLVGDVCCMNTDSAAIGACFREELRFGVCKQLNLRHESR